MTKHKRTDKIYAAVNNTTIDQGKVRQAIHDFVTSQIKPVPRVYIFQQSCSRGKMLRTNGLAETVYIEATSADEANKIAESIGIDFHDEHLWNSANDNARSTWCWSHEVEKHIKNSLDSFYTLRFIDMAYPFAVVHFANSQTVGIVMSDGSSYFSTAEECLTL